MKLKCCHLTADFWYLQGQQDQTFLTLAHSVLKLSKLQQFNPQIKPHILSYAIIYGFNGSPRF